MNHLTYVDDTIIFASADPYSHQKIVGLLSKYEKTSGQLINKAKTSYYMYANTTADLVNIVGHITGFTKGEFPFTYLGCPVFYKRKNITMTLLKRSRTSYTHGRVNYFLMENLCLPKEEGGLGFRSLFDVSRAIFAKLWLNLRTTKTLWANFMRNKYCKKELPTTVQFKEGSHVWRKILEAGEEVEHEILWELNKGTINIWHENWTGLGALYHLVPPDFDTNELREGNDSNFQMLENTFPAKIAPHISQELHIGNTYEGWDTPKWMPATSERFSVTTA
ncbi:uncharacterized protein LOC142168948 [Nicotiana tabacum]|uniref:Uncharacterized protein LOC142168948 n=1 Tax=Nicotiana tabacum TaxID=4097 RepID=A0AC58SML9_TOBAC